MQHGEQPNPEPITATGKLIALSDDGRAVDFHATIEDRGEHITLTGITATEAAALRPHIGRPVTLRVEGAGCPDWKAQHGHLLRMLGARDHADAGRCIAERDRAFMELQQVRDANESLDARLTDTMRTLWLVLHESGGAIIARRHLERVDWSRCRTHQFTDMATGDVHLEATLSSEVWEIDEQPVAATRAELTDALRRVADALGVPLEFDALDETVEAMVSAAANACCWADRQAEVAITSALGCSDNLAAVLEAIKIARQGAASSVATAAALGGLLKMLDANDPTEAAEAIDALKREAALAAPTFMGEPVLAGPRPGTGIRDIMRERLRQITAEGYSRETDRICYGAGQLAMAASAYLGLVTRDASSPFTGCPPEWPWGPETWKPKDRRANLVRAGALIAAELDRIDGCEDAPTRQLYSIACPVKFDGLANYAAMPDKPEPLAAAVPDLVVEPPHTGTGARLGDFPANTTPVGRAIEFHPGGGIAGLSRDEVPAILQRGEEVLGEDDPRSPPRVTVTVSGKVGTGKSAVALAILDALRAAGLSCEWSDEFGERNLGTGAEDIATLDVKPLVVLHELVEPVTQNRVETDPTYQQAVQNLADEAAKASTGVPLSIDPVERALRWKAMHEDGAAWPDAYSDEEQEMERETMRGVLNAANGVEPGTRFYAIEWAEIDERGMVSIYRNGPRDWPSWVPRAMLGESTEQDRAAAGREADQAGGT